jgi:hypothetical protein
MIAEGTFAPKMQFSEIKVVKQAGEESEESDDKEGFKKNENDKDDDGEDDQFEARRTDYEQIDFKSTMMNFVK